MIYLYLASSILLGAAGHLLVKTGLARAGPVLADPIVLAGIASYGLSFLLFMPWLSSRPAGVAVPAAGLTYALVAAAGWFIRGETLSVIQICGIVTIGAGVWMLTFK
jgi:multidrug transporter EmrE-like cation transporter